MASARRGSRSALIETLREHPERFDFLQTVRILERAAAQAARDPRFAEAGRVGLADDPRSESVFLRATAETVFPPSEVHALAEKGPHTDVTVSLMGLNGPAGVLPEHYSQIVLEELRHKNTALRDFLDILNHRALSLFVRAMEKYRLGLLYERAGHESEDTISQALAALLGILPDAFRRRQAVPDATLLFYAGHFSRRTRTAGALAQVLSDFFEQPVTIRQFQGRWVSLPESEQTRLGKERGAGRYAALGESAVIGARIWDVQGSFRVCLGPLGYIEFRSFMPDGVEMAELVALTRTYVGAALSFDVQLTLKAAEIPPLQLSGGDDAMRLGWNTWLPSIRPRADARDAVFRIESV